MQGLPVYFASQHRHTLLRFHLGQRNFDTFYSFHHFLSTFLALLPLLRCTGHTNWMGWALGIIRIGRSPTKGWVVLTYTVSGVLHIPYSILGDWLSAFRRGIRRMTLRLQLLAHTPLYCSSCSIYRLFAIKKRESNSRASFPFLAKLGQNHLLAVYSVYPLRFSHSLF